MNPFSDIFRLFGRPEYWWAPKLWCPKRHFSSFAFQLYFNKKYIEVGINSKWLRIQKYRQKRKTYKTKRPMQRKKLSMEVFSFI